MRQHYLAAVVAAGGLLLGACATMPVPSAQLAQSKAAIRAAEEADAEKIPDARLHLKLARDQVEQANKLIEDGEHDDAVRALQRAELDAEFALALAKSADARSEADEIRQRVAELKAEGGMAAPVATPPSPRIKVETSSPHVDVEVEVDD